MVQGIKIGLGVVNFLLGLIDTKLPINQILMVTIREIHKFLNVIGLTVRLLCIGFFQCMFTILNNSCERQSQTNLNKHPNLNNSASWLRPSHLKTGSYKKKPCVFLTK